MNTFLLFGLLWGCNPQPEKTAQAPTEEKVETVEKVSESGPVKVTVRMSPKVVRLGDPIRLELEVVAEKDVEVDLPPFGEALGRFQIADFSPRKSQDSSGKTLAIQSYTLQAPMSGQQRIPALRIVFRDLRQDPNAEEKEILTEELPITVSSLLDADAPLAFKAAKAPLTALPKDTPMLYAIPAILLLMVGAWFGWRRLQAWRRKEEIRSAYQKAMDALLVLEQKGLTDPDTIDLFYSELSMIIRSYLKARYGIQAPEQTTEEFLNTAQRSDQLSDPHKLFLQQFLERADEVKFARQRPTFEESNDTTSKVRNFLRESRPVEDAA